MKKNFHPDYHEVEVVMTNGDTFKTRTTWGTPGAKLKLDIDPTTHPAWNAGEQRLVDHGGRVSRFQKRYSGIFAPK